MPFSICMSLPRGCKNKRGNPLVWHLTSSAKLKLKPNLIPSAIPPYFDPEYSAQMDSHIKFEFCDKNTKKDKQNTTYCTLHLSSKPIHACSPLPYLPYSAQSLFVYPSEGNQETQQVETKKTENVSTKPYTIRKVSTK